MAVAHIGYAEAVAAMAADGDERAQLNARAVETLRGAIASLDGMQSPYAESFRVMVADIESGGIARGAAAG